MGLLLSILVTCVGVVELLDFYYNIKRNVITTQLNNSLTDIKTRYRNEFEKQQSNRPQIKCNGITPNEEIELQFEHHQLESNRSRTPSPRKFLLTEKDSENLPRKFLVKQLENDNDENLPQFRIKENKTGTTQEYSIKNKPGELPPLPLPKQFLVSESMTPDVIENDRNNERSQSPIPLSFHDDNDYFRRSPSPYPSLLINVPRNSICSELHEVDEEDSKSPTPEERAEIVLQSKHNTCDYWNNPIQIFPKDYYEQRVRSRTPDAIKSKQQIQRRKSKSESELSNEISQIYNQKFLNSLDGVEKKKTKGGKLKKRQQRANRDDILSSSNDTAKTLTEAANLLKNTNKMDGDDGAGPSRDRNPTTPEPFWLIFSGEYTKAMNKDWHGQHFCCWQCDESLTGQRYVLRDDHPYCVSCYESVFANACEKCSRIIGIDSKDLSYKDKHWHEACFLCTTCGESLVDKQFGSKGDRIYCGRCYDEQFASRCDGCHEIFRAGTKKMEYKTRQWHEKCFCCCVCKVPIGTQSFIPREQEIYCAKCYEEKFATRCIKCNKVITSGGVTYKNEPWHRECFTCTHCSKSLAGERFTSRDEKPYCAECFGELFAKRCFACNKPITGIGGTKFISFEDRHWHNDCFFCASCRTSLVGRGFITDQDDIICPECAKQKLM